MNVHLKLGEVLVIHLDVVHWLEGLLGHFLANALVDAAENRHGFVFVVEVLVVSAHVVGIVVSDGDIVGPLHRSENLPFSPVARRL